MSRRREYVLTLTAEQYGALCNAAIYWDTVLEDEVDDGVPGAYSRRRALSSATGELDRALRATIREAVS